MWSLQFALWIGIVAGGYALAATRVWTMLALELDIGTRRQRFVGACTMIALVASMRRVRTQERRSRIRSIGIRQLGIRSFLVRLHYLTYTWIEKLLG